MSKVLNFLSILGLLGFIITLWWDKHQMGKSIDPVIIVLLLIGAVFVYAQNGIWSLLLKIGISFLELGYTIAKINLISIQQFKELSYLVGAIVIALFGFYVMFGGMKKNNDEIHLSINPKTGKVKRRWF